MRRRRELTFQDNRDRGRHGWLRLTPAYSVSLVDAVLERAPPGCRVLDPFSGTGTTALAGAWRGHEVVGLDINPFLVWLGNAKLARYGAIRRRRAGDAAGEALDRARAGRCVPCTPPPMRHVERWWSPSTLEALCTLKGALDAAARPGTAVHDLLTLAFCSATIESSAAAFDHQSMSFHTGGQRNDCDPLERFDAHVERLLASAARTPPGQPRVRRGDARSLRNLRGARFDRIVTSPPYPNRMSYIRELRPYMYWTGFLSDGREAGEIDWRAIGGTWGVATSRLHDWTRDPDVPLPRSAERRIRAIARSDAKHGPVLARYVARYFEDMARHLRAVHPYLAPGARAHYIVGNSKFYDVLVPTHRILEQLMRDTGFPTVSVSTLRKRNSKKELFEYEVTGRV